MTTSEPPADAQDTAETQRAGVKMLTAALAYAKRGWPIFPCRPGTKVPLTKNGVLDATTNPQQIDKWWTATPDANIGLDVGGANMLALDYDPGFNLEVLENNVGPIPKTGLRCRTPRGGQHCYLTIGVDECVPASTSKLAPHVDVRSFHSYTLLPPSKTKDGSYTWIEDGPPAWRSERIFQATATGRSKSEDRDEWTIEPDLDENIALATKWLQSDAKVAVEGQGGDHCAYATAAMMKSYGISPELAFDLMLEHWNPRCNPPWGPDEADHLQQKVENAYTYNTSPPGNITSAYWQAKHRELFQRKPRLIWKDGKCVDWGIPPPTENELAELEREREKALDPLSLIERMQAALGNDVGSFPAIPLYDLDELAALPAPEWDMEGLIGRAKLGMIVGKWGQYKTFLALDMAVALAGQLPWPAVSDKGCKQYPIPKPRRVLYIAAEGGAAEYNQRLGAALRNRKEFDLDQVKRNFVLAAASAPLDTTAGQEAIADAIERGTEKLGGPPEVIFCDTLAKSMTGEENSNTDMGKVQRVAAAIQRALDCTFIFVHHTGKDGEKSGRGASSMPGGLDFLIHVTGEKTTKLAMINVEKQKDAPEEKNIYLQGRVVGQSLAFARVAEKPSNPKEQLTHWYRQRLAEIIEEHRGQPLTATQLVEELAPDAIPDFDTLEGESRRKELEKLRQKVRRDLFDPKKAKSAEAEDFRDRYREGYGQKTIWRHKDAMGS